MREGESSPVGEIGATEKRGGASRGGGGAGCRGVVLARADAQEAAYPARRQKETVPETETVTVAVTLTQHRHRYPDAQTHTVDGDRRSSC